MVWKGIKNFFINLKYFFTPLGAFALGMVLGLSVLLPVIGGAVQTLATNISELSGNISFDFEALVESLSDAVSRLDWNNLSASVRTMLSREWLSNTFNECIYSLLPGAEEYAAQITEEINAAISKMVNGFAGFAVFSALGLIGGFFLTRHLVKKTIAGLPWWKNFLSALYDLIIVFAFTYIILWIKNVWSPSVIITGVLSVILFGFLTLLRAYLLYGRKKIKAGKVINLKNIIVLVITNVVICITAGAVMALAYALTNIIVGTFMAVSLVEIGVLVIAYNADSYVKTKADKENFIRRGRAVFENYYPHFCETPKSMIYAVEDKFDGVLFKDELLNGKIDRVEKLSDGTYALYDYKTSSPVSKNQYREGGSREDYYNQLCCYKYAFEKKTGFKVSQVGVIYVENHTKSVTLELGQEDMNYIENLVVDTYQNIRNLNFKTPIASQEKSCGFCGYKELCKLDVI